MARNNFPTDTTLLHFILSFRHLNCYQSKIIANRCRICTNRLTLENCINRLKFGANFKYLRRCGKCIKQPTKIVSVLSKTRFFYCRNEDGPLYHPFTEKLKYRR